mgnify:CR=1 FL=1
MFPITEVDLAMETLKRLISVTESHTTELAGFCLKREADFGKKRTASRAVGHPGLPNEGF